MIIEVGKKYKHKTTDNIVTVVYTNDTQVVYEHDHMFGVRVRAMQNFVAMFSEWREPMRLEFEATARPFELHETAGIELPTKYSGTRFKVTLEEIV